jgi:hypothetical protein
VYLGTMVLSAIGLLIGGVGRDEHHAGERDGTHAARLAFAKRLARSAKTLPLAVPVWEAMTLTGAGGILALVLVNALVLLIPGDAEVARNRSGCGRRCWASA